MFSVGKHPSEGVSHANIHRDHPRSGCGFRLFNDIFTGTFALQLMGNRDLLFFQINIRKGQPTELGNAESCIEQNINPVIVLAEMSVALYKRKKKALLFRSNRFPPY